MLTLNAYKIMTSSVCGIHGGVFTQLDGTNATAKDGYSINTGSNRFDNVLTATPGSTAGVIFGNGNTPPTLSDYKLSGSIITTISATASVTNGYDNDSAYVTAVYTITNTGSSEITISEVGLYSYIVKNYAINSTATTTGSTFGCLVDRTVLDTPVTIPAGGVGQVTYTIRFDYPTA